VRRRNQATPRQPRHQEWVNDGVDALTAGKPVAKFSGAVEDEDEDKPPAKAKASNTKVKTGKKKPAAARKGVTAQTMMKQMVLHNLDITTDEIIDRMERAGYSPTRFLVATTKSNFKNALKVIKGEGVDVRKLNIK
jgi:hypothetical protein